MAVTPAPSSRCQTLSPGAADTPAPVAFPSRHGLAGHADTRGFSPGRRHTITCGDCRQTVRWRSPGARGGCCVSAPCVRCVRVSHLLREEAEGRQRKRPHVGEAVGLACFQRDRALEGAGDGETGVAGRVPVTVAGRPGRARLGEPPRRAEALACRTREERRRDEAARRGFRHRDTLLPFLEPRISLDSRLLSSEILHRVS